MTYDLSSAETSLQVALQQADLSSPEATTRFWKSGVKISQRREKYLRYRASTSLTPNVILYHSMSGDRVSDNPLAMLEFLLSHPEYGSYLHVWGVKKDTKIPLKYQSNPNVVFAPLNTAAYTYFLATADHIISNVGLPEYFMRRTGQKYLNTWHGTPYKALGRDTAHGLFGQPSSVRSFLKATHVISTCKFMTDALFSAYSMLGTSTAKIAETGYPRVDITLNDDAEFRKDLHQALGISATGTQGDSRPVVLYAPTWRSQDEHDHVNIDHLMKDLKVLAALDIQLLYRGHHRIARMIQDQVIGDQVNKVIVPPDELSTNEILSVVDILITDYSSIFFDFLGTGKPIVHYLYDLKEYSQQRGLNLEITELPGDVALTREALSASVSALAKRLINARPLDSKPSPLQGERYKNAQARFSPHDDGAAAQRTVDFFLLDKADPTWTREARDERPTLAFWAGRLDNSLESRRLLQRAMKCTASGEFQTTLIIDHESKIDRTTLKALKALEPNISTIPYQRASPILLPAEKTAYEGFTAHTHQDFESICTTLRADSHLREIFTREHKRRLGDTTFDRILISPDVLPHELALAAAATQFDFTKVRILSEVKASVFQRGLERIRTGLAWRIGAAVRTVEGFLHIRLPRRN